MFNSSNDHPTKIQMMIRKQSLVNQSTNPFVVVIQKLDQLPTNINDITREQIVSLTEPLVGWCSPDEMMSLAKTTSRTLFIDIEPNERVQVINNLVRTIPLSMNHTHSRTQLNFFVSSSDTAFQIETSIR